ncbi:MAG TPA: hypothetical protein VFR24_03230, partial [Candidatus Angelobacter sp.]|nr:hypothetical protein [Candidatus Angelobacter sp.]
MSFHGPNLAMNFFDVSRTAAHIANVKLPVTERVVLNTAGYRNRASHFSEVEFVKKDFGALVENQFRLDRTESLNSGPYTAEAYQDQQHRWQVCGTKKAAEVAIRFAGGCYCLLFGCLFIWFNTTKFRRVVGPTLVGLGLAAFLFPPYYEGDCENYGKQPPLLLQQHSHSGNTVPQKYLLTTNNYWGTFIGRGNEPMANVLDRDQQIAVVSALAEGSAIRASRIQESRSVQA